MPTDRPKESRRHARARITGEVMAAARRQLAEVGAAGLSLREVARDIGMVSSAVYRYVESRDDLLTRLIVEAYDALGATAERASAAAVERSADADLDRWCAVAQAIRAWALDHPHEYLLLYGTPVPGYAAPELTVVPGIRPTIALLRVVADANDAGRLADPAEPLLDDGGSLHEELTVLASAADTALRPATTLAFIAAWTQLFGLLSFEITNQTRGMIEQHDLLFAATTRRLGHQVGLRSPAGNMSS